MKLGIFGGTFNPIHYGHLRAAEEVREKANLDKILFVPAGNPPLKSEGIADASHRCEMVRLAISDNPFFELSDIECGYAGKSYTVNTIEKLTMAYPGADLFFILGIDAFLDLPNWRQPERLTALTNFVVISRPNFRFAGLAGSPYLEKEAGALKDIDESFPGVYETKLKSQRDALLLKLTLMDISSTEVRRLIKQDKSIKYLLPPGVQFYIITNGLYKN